MACGCSKIQSVGAYGLNPDGLGEAPGGGILVFIGLVAAGAGVAGYFLAPKKHRVLGALGGVGAGYAAAAMGWLNFLVTPTRALLFPGEVAKTGQVTVVK